MDKPAFKNYLASIKTHIARVINAAEATEQTILRLTSNVQNEMGLPQSQNYLKIYMADLDVCRADIDVLKAFYEDIKKRWGKTRQRVIGHIVWAPLIGVGAAPHHYTRDLCVVALYKERFTNLLGNVLRLGAVPIPSHTTLCSSKMTHCLFLPI